MDTTTPGGQTPPATDSTLPDPFEVSFDFDDNWCANDVGYVLEDLTDALADDHPDLLRLFERELAGVDTDTAHTLMSRHVTDLKNMLADGTVDEDDADDLLDTLREAASRLTWHEGGCDCAMFAYNTCGKPELDYYLGTLGDQLWAVSRGDRHDDDINDQLSVERLSDLLCPRDGFSRMKLTWDGATLTAGVRYPYPGGYTDAELTPLTADQVDMYDTWSGYLYSGCEDLASCIAESAADVLKIADTFWLQVDNPDVVRFGPDELLTALNALPGNTRRHLDVDVVVALADGWSGTLAQLLATSLTVAAPAA